ncbi:MAG: leucine-rich repeat domain-containing protein [Ruminococcaceae bacterium]|nr:leucine-rich repeat domain-containing protein [Oscillospiraceae bacterium]
MKGKWFWIVLSILAVALVVLAIGIPLWHLLVLQPSPDPEHTPTTTTTVPAEDVVIPGHLTFTGKVLEVDSGMALMECYDKEKFDTVWVNYAGTPSVMPQVGEEYLVTYEDLVMPSLPPRITAVEMTILIAESQDDEYISGDFICKNVDDGVEIVKCINTSVRSVEVPAEIGNRPVVSLGSNAFYQHKNLKSVVLPEGLKRLVGSCFYRCYSLQKVMIPSTVSEITSNPFWRASALVQIEVAEGNVAFKAEDGVLYDAAGAELISFPEGKEQESFYLPGCVKLIREDAFGYHPKVKNLYLTEVVRLESVSLTANEKDLCLHIIRGSYADKLLQESDKVYHPYKYR